MYFKFLSLILKLFFVTTSLVLIFTALLVGCAGENRPAKSTPRIEQKSSKCLSATLVTMNQYFKGQAQESKINEAWDCLASVIIEFGDYVQGNTKNVFTGEELRGFIENNFLQTYKPQAEGEHLLTDAFLHEMMAVKRLFLGGSVIFVTAKELHETLAFIEEMRGLSLQFKPYAPLLFNLDQQIGPSEEIVQNLKKNVEIGLKSFFRRLIKNNSTYELEDLQRLLAEVYKLSMAISPAEGNSDLSVLVPVVAQLKFLFLNSEPKVLSIKDYHELPLLLSKVSGLYIQAKFSVNKNNLFDVNKFANLKTLLESGVDLLRIGLVAREEISMPTQEFDGLIAALEKAKLLPFDLSLAEAKGLSRLFIDFILKQQGLNNSEGLNSSKLNLIREKISEWASVQELILKNQEDLSNLGWLQMKALVTDAWGLNLDRQERVVINGQAGVSSAASLTRLNWLRGLLTFLSRAYILDKARADRFELTGEELHRAFLDLRPLLVGLGLVEKFDLEFDKSLFREANLFMPRSDGNELLSSYELIEYLHYVFSGVSAGDYFISQCVSVKDEIEYKCFYNKFINFYGQFLAHMPSYAQYVSHLDPSLWQKDLNLIELMGRTTSHKGEPLKKYEIYRAFIFLQYIEVTILRFDKDGSGTIGVSEGLAALSHFNWTVANILGLSVTEDSEYIESLFTYLLHYGEIPGADDPLSDLKFLHWRWHRNSWSFSVSRSSLLQILTVMNNLGK